MQVSFLSEQPQFVPTIAQWYFQEWASMVPDVTVQMVKDNVAKKSLSRDSVPTAMVAHDQHELLGAIELKLRENKHYPQYEHWIGGVFVAPEHRRKGIAKTLVNAAKKHAQQLGIDVVYLQCESHNVGLYQQLGFVSLHQAKHHDIETTIMHWQAS